MPNVFKWWRDKIFPWWRDKDNREAAKSIADVLKIVVPALVVAVVAVLGYLGWSGLDPAGPPQKPQIAAGDAGMIQTGSGIQVRAEGGATVTVGFTEEMFHAALEDREARVRAEMHEAGDAERMVLQAQLVEIAAQKANLERAHSEALDQLAALAERLDALASDLPADRLAEARQALARGDRSLADDLFAEVAAQTLASVELAAKAAFARGEIAAQDIRWRDAAEHFATAARLDPGIESLEAAGNYLRASGQYDRALSHDRAALALAQDQFGTDSLEVAQAASNLALTLISLGDYEAARPLIRDSLDITEARLGRASSEYGIRLNNLASIHRDLGDEQSAEAMFTDSVEILRAARGPDDAELAIALSNLGAFLSQVKRLDEAEHLLREAQDITERAYGRNHPDFAVRLNNIAHVLQSQGQDDEALALFHEAADVIRNVLGEEHQQYAIALSNIGGIHHKAGEVDAAEGNYRRALDILRASVGDHHPTTRIAADNYLMLLEAYRRDATEVEDLRSLLAAGEASERP